MSDLDPVELYVLSNAVGIFMDEYPLSDTERAAARRLVDRFGLDAVPYPNELKDTVPSDETQ